LWAIDWDSKDKQWEQDTKVGHGLAGRGQGLASCLATAKRAWYSTSGRQGGHCAGLPSEEAAAGS